MRSPFRRKPSQGNYPATDSGRGSLKDYGYDLVPTNRNVVIRLAGSDPAREVLEPLVVVEKIDAFVARRSLEEERTDAPIDVRFFLDGRLSGVVGRIPRGLEPVVFEALTRLEDAGRPLRLPAAVVSTKNGPRVDIKLGQTR